MVTATRLVSDAPSDAQKVVDEGPAYEPLAGSLRIRMDRRMAVTNRFMEAVNGKWLIVR